MRIAISVAFLGALLSAVPAARAQGGRGNAAGQSAAVPVVRPEAIRAHMRFLADDLLEGRAAGERGFDIAAQYVASQFESFGLLPGDDGTFFQSVPLRRGSIANASFSLRSSGDAPLTWGTEFIVRPNLQQSDLKVTGPIVFCGHGISAPEYGVDDYAGLDVRRKLVAIFTRGGDSLPPIPRAVYTSFATKLATAEAKGAIGVIQIQDNDALPNAPPVFGWQDKQTGRSSESASLPFILLTKSAAAPLFQRAPRSVEQIRTALRNGMSQSFDTMVVAAVTAATTVVEKPSRNVVAILRGSDPQLRDQYVVYSAHLDHLGVGAAVNGDTIYNGAVDNASGIAAMLEVARAFSAQASLPRRSVLFLATTAEERGLLGSDYFAEVPTVPREHIVANVNGDGANVLAPEIRDVIAYGSDESTIGRVVADMATTFGIQTSADPAPQEAFFVRSDQYSFVRRGIPSLWLFAGLHGREFFDRFQSTHYHRPSDDVALFPALNFDSGARWAQLQFFVIQRIANDPEQPKWNRDSFLAQRFALSR